MTEGALPPDPFKLCCPIMGAGLLDDLAYGWRTALLSLVVAQLLVLAAALGRTLPNRAANRTLAALLVVLAGIVAPWMIGFAGFYDKWRWLTFLPVAVPLAIGPLLWLYAHALAHGHWPERGWRHLLPAMVELGIGTALFALPMPLKWQVAEALGGLWGRMVDAATVISLVVYAMLSIRLIRRYRAHVAQVRADDERFAVRWLAAAIVAMLALLTVWAGYALWDALDPLGYKGLMGLYLAVGAIALYLGIEGWRHAALPFPQMMREIAPPEPTPRDWSKDAARWAAQVRASDWAADPDLSLPALARRLGTNSGHLSRAINQGLGVNFATFVNGLRAERVAALIGEGRKDDLLDLALEAGFSSKASFNRAFVARYGVTPSVWRRTHVSDRDSPGPDGN